MPKLQSRRGSQRRMRRSNPRSEPPSAPNFVPPLPLSLSGLAEAQPGRAVGSEGQGRQRQRATEEGRKPGLHPCPRIPTHSPPGSRPALGQEPGGGSRPAPRRAEAAWAAAAAGTTPGSRGSGDVFSGCGAGKLWRRRWRRRPLAADVAPDATRPLRRLLSSRLLPRLRLRGARALLQPGPLPRPPGLRPPVSRRVRPSQQSPTGFVPIAHARRSEGPPPLPPVCPRAPPWEPPAGLRAPAPGVSPPFSATIQSDRARGAKPGRRVGRGPQAGCFGICGCPESRSVPSNGLQNSEPSP